MSLTADFTDILDDDDQNIVPAEEFYSVLDELTKDLTRGRCEEYNSIINKVICLAHGLPPPEINIQDSENRKKRRKSLLKFVKQHKPDFISSNICIAASKSLECHTPASKSNYIDPIKEVQETLKKRIKELDLPEDYQVTELVTDIWDSESHLLDNQSGHNETTCSVIITKDDDTKNNSQQFQIGKASREETERSRKAVKRHRTVNGNSDDLKNNVEDTVQSKRKKIGKPRTGNGNNDKLTNNVEDTVQSKRKKIGKPRTVNDNNDKLTNSFEDTVQSKTKNICKSAAIKKACGNAKLPLPTEKPLNNEPRMYTFVLTELLDSLFIPPELHHKQALKSSMKSNNYSPMYYFSISKNTTNKTPQPAESSASNVVTQVVTEATSQGQANILVKANKRSNSCQDNRNTRKKTKIDDKHKNFECKEVHLEEIFVKHKTQCLLPEETSLLSKNGIIKETAKKRGRPKKKSSDVENSLQVLGINEVSPALQTLHSPLKQAYTLPGKEVPVISPCKMRRTPKMLPENNVSGKISKRSSLKENISTDKPSLEVLFVTKATPVKDISDVTNMQNLSVKKISPKQISSCLPPKAVCNVSEDEITKEMTGKRRARSYTKSGNKKLLQDVSLQKVSLTGKGQEIISSSDIIALSPSKDVSHLQDKNNAPQSTLNDGSKLTNACQEGTLVALSENDHVANNGGHKLIENISSDEYPSKEITEVKVSDESKTEASHISSREGTSCKRIKGKLVLIRTLSESKKRFVFRYFSEEEEKRKKKRFNFLEENSDNEIEEASKGESMNTTKQAGSTIMEPEKTSDNISIKQDIYKKPHSVTSLLSNKDIKNKLKNRQRWHKCQEEDIISGIDVVTKKRKSLSSRHSKGINYSKNYVEARHMESQLMFQKETFQEFSTIIADATGPVSPPLRAESPDILIIPRDRSINFPKILPQYGSKTMEGESHTSIKPTKNKSLPVSKPINTETFNSKTHLNVNVADDMHKKYPPLSYSVDNSESDEELNLLNVEGSSLALRLHQSSLRAAIPMWETFHNSELQSIRVERSQTSQQRIKTQKSGQSFFNLDNSEEMQTFQQNSVFDNKSQAGESQSNASSGSQTSRRNLIDTSCVPNYSILGGERWLAAVKSVNAHKKPVLLVASHCLQKTKKTKKKTNRS